MEFIEMEPKARAESQQTEEDSKGDLVPGGGKEGGGGVGGSHVKKAQAHTSLLHEGGEGEGRTVP